MIVVNTGKYRRVLEYLEDDYKENHNMEINIKMFESCLRENEEQEKKIKDLEMEIERLKGINSRGAGRKPKLSESDREKVKLYRIDGKSLNEIAEIFKCSTKTIQRILKA